MQIVDRSDGSVCNKEIVYYPFREQGDNKKYVDKYDTWLSVTRVTAKDLAVITLHTGGGTMTVQECSKLAETIESAANAAYDMNHALLSTEGKTFG
jgi:hypothetical protein